MKKLFFRQKIIDNFGSEILVKPFGSIVHKLGFEKEFLSVLDEIIHIPKTMIEIGTCSGISTLYFAQWASQISTFDIQEVEIKHKLWEFFGIKNISAYVAKDSTEIATILKNLEFDFAFVDGAHDYQSVVQDIAMVKKCGRILFHDYYSLKIRRAIKKLIAKEGGKLKIETLNFAYWEKI